MPAETPAVTVIGEPDAELIDATAAFEVLQVPAAGAPAVNVVVAPAHNETLPAVGNVGYKTGTDATPAVPVVPTPPAAPPVLLLVDVVPK